MSVIISDVSVIKKYFNQLQHIIFTPKIKLVDFCTLTSVQCFTLFSAFSLVDLHQNIHEATTVCSDEGLMGQKLISKVKPCIDVSVRRSFLLGLMFPTPTQDYAGWSGGCPAYTKLK